MFGCHESAKISLRPDNPVGGVNPHRSDGGFRGGPFDGKMVVVVCGIGDFDRHCAASRSGATLFHSLAAQFQRGECALSVHDPVLGRGLRFLRTLLVVGYRFADGDCRGLGLVVSCSFS